MFPAGEKDHHFLGTLHQVHWMHLILLHMFYTVLHLFESLTLKVTLHNQINNTKCNIILYMLIYFVYICLRGLYNLYRIQHPLSLEPEQLPKKPHRYWGNIWGRFFVTNILSTWEYTGTEPQVANCNISDAYTLLQCLLNILFRNWSICLHLVD